MTRSTPHAGDSRFSSPRHPLTKAPVRFGGRPLRLGAVLLAVLLCHQAAWGKPITPQQAEKTAKAWLATDGQPLGTPIGRETAGKTESFAGPDGQPLYYVVNLKPSGFVILPADDLAEPIVCFAASGQYDPSDDNPLGALVSRDLAGRVQFARESETSARGGKAMSPSAANARAKWNRLAEESDDAVTMGLPGLSDIRVAPLLQSKWSQTTECGNPCYNYYTPSNYPTGCVATAQAQLMRFYQHPTAGVGMPGFSIEVCGAPQTNYLRGGNGSGGPYNWADMVLDPDCTTSDLQRQAIGALCYDVGVTVSMNYCSGASSASSFDTIASLKNTFGYSNGIWGYNNNSNIGSGLDGMANPNLDAGYPVLLSIKRPGGGHAVVADGYGYQAATLYHHLNMGWAGTSDAWYNLPNIDSSPYSYDSVDACVYNIYITGSGEIISGRVVDSFGLPISGATVVAQRTGGGTYTTTTAITGVYALAKVPSASSYMVSASASGYSFTSQPVTTGTSSDWQAVSGNAWGVNFAAAGCCAASGGCTEYISGVQVGSINNTGTACDGYKDYTHLSTGMEIASSHPITVTNGSPRSADQCGIWVDWNRDNDFSDPGETIAVSGTSGPGPYTATISPPAGASLGNTRMRVRIAYTGAMSPCGSATYGEVEDYMIVVSPTTYSISGTVTSGGIGVAGVTVTPSPSGEPATTDDSGNYTISGLSAGTYTITPAKLGCTFTPGSIGSITVGPSQTGKNFTASCVLVYCGASGGCSEHITRVQVGSINNGPTTCDGYRDYTNLSTSMAIGSSYPITVTNSDPYYLGDQCGVWVDWNRDGDFGDSGETFALSGDWSFTGSITPPIGISTGLCRMRVRITYTGTLSPCGTTQYGEVEDYTINVTPQKFSISGSVTSGGSGVAGVTMTPSPSGTPVTTDGSGNYTISGLDPGTYTVTPSKVGCTFTPTSISGITVGPNQTGRNFTATCTVSYCAATGGCDEYISGVQVGSINNLGTLCNNYRDYTNLSTTMAIGSNYTIVVTNGRPYTQDQCGIWVDWNRDGDFYDAGETMAVSGTPGQGSFTATITPPAGASQGDTRLRVRITYTGSVLPCGSTSYGEVEDYTVNVTGCTAPDAPTGVNASDMTYCDRIRVTWSAVSGAQSYNIYRSSIDRPCAEPPLATGVTGTSYDDTSTDLDTTQYYYSVKAVGACGTGACSTTDPGRRGGAPVDFDLDCDVDAEDYDLFDACASGPGVAAAAGCQGADFDLDNDVDQSDFSTFQRCVSGENVPADPDCAN